MSFWKSSHENYLYPAACISCDHEKHCLRYIEKQAEQADAFVFAKAAFSQQLDNMEFFNKANDGIGK